VPRFLPVPVYGCEAKGHDEAIKRHLVLIDGSVVSCHDEIVSVTSKKQSTSASAGQPKDAVPGDKTDLVPENFINGTEFNRGDFWVGYKVVSG